MVTRAHRRANTHLVPSTPKREVHDEANHKAADLANTLGGNDATIGEILSLCLEE